MDRVQELLNALAQPEIVAREAGAKAQKTCKICGEKACTFRTQRAALEYSISTICQDCQDYFLLAEIN